MLVEALQEFEQGRKLARPDMLLDTEEWRISIISRTEELNRLIDPKPRVTRSGVRFRANARMVRRESQRLPEVSDGAKASNSYAEEQHKTESTVGRARLGNTADSAKGIPVAPAVVPNAKLQKDITILPEQAPKPSAEARVEESKAKKAAELPPSRELAPSKQVQESAPKAGTKAVNGTPKKVQEQEDDIARIIEEALKEKLGSDNEGAAQ